MMNVMACGRAFKTRISACYTPERHFCRSFFIVLLHYPIFIGYMIIGIVLIGILYFNCMENR